MRLLLIIFIFFSSIYANTVKNEIANIREYERHLENVYLIKEQLHVLNNDLKDNIVIKNYKTYQEYLKLKSDLDEAKATLEKAKKTKRIEIEEEIKSLEDRLSVLKDYENYSIAKYLHLPSEPEENKRISNIYLVIEGLGYRKTLINERKDYENKLKDFANLVYKLDEKTKLLEELGTLEKNEIIENDLKYSIKLLADCKSTLENTTRAYGIYQAKVNNIIRLIDADIKKQYDSAVNFLAIIFCIFIARYLLGLIIRKYVDDKDKVYTSQKVLNIFTFVIVSLFSLFYFVENINYLVSVLGFASAGLAIAMKDMFMSLLGWIVLQFGGGFHVGDRVKVMKNGVVYVGDIIDISLLKIIIYEDITLTTYVENRRAGRLIYIPNNYIFTELISNYNYSYMKTVWDGIDVCIDFNSNVEKAKQIILEAAQYQSQAFADSAKKAIQKMRNHYQMKNSGTDARIYVILESYGIKISVWYMANSREALKMRSLVSEEIIKRIKECSDIKLAFPSQTIYIDKRKNQPIREIDENLY